MNKLLKMAWCVVIGMFLWLGIDGYAWAVTQVDLAKQPVVEVGVDLGNAENALRFFPSEFQFVAGKRYKLILTNPSPQKHYFTAKDFADASWTQKVQAGKVEIKGNIHELELKPEGTAEWVFVPIKAGTYLLRCSIAGHTEAGMTGMIKVVATN